MPNHDSYDVDRFATLFSGYSKAYGTYTTGKAGENGKVSGRAMTHRGAPSLSVYADHLNGTGPGLGVIMLREDDTVLFGAIDYDSPTMDHQKAEATVTRLGLPLVLCRSKSGGGHFYCFVQAPVPASVMRDRLAEWTAMLGMAASTEQFPKQSSRVSESDVGNWINLPYYAAETTVRYAIVNGQQLTLDEFLTHAALVSVPHDRMYDSWLVESSLFVDGPPCLQTLEAQGGFADGTKKNGMFDVAVYLRKAFPDDWETRMDEYNQKLARITSQEVQGIIKQVGKKTYTYRCKEPPINSVCNRRQCRTALHGVGQGTPESQGTLISDVTRYDSMHGDEPLWSMEVNGKRVMVTTQQLYSRDDFNRAVMSQVNSIPVHMAPAQWLRYLSEMIRTATMVPLPPDASPLGQLWERIEMFATQNVDAQTREEVLLGKPRREMDRETNTNRTYFRSMDLFSYLDTRRVAYKSPQMVWSLLRDKGGATTFWNLKGKGVNVWSIPTPDMPMEDDAPEVDRNSTAF